MLGLLTTMLALFVIVPGSFAQGFVQLQVSNQPSASEIQTNRDANTWDPSAQGTGILVFGTFQGSGTTTSSILRISFPAPITASPNLCGSINTTTFAVPASTCSNGTVGPNIPGGVNGDPIRIEGQGGIFSNVANPVLNTSNSRIEVVLPGGANFNTASGTTGQFRLFGVRFDANNKSGAQTGSVTLTDQSGYTLTSTPTLTYTNGFGAGIGSMAVGSSGTNQNLGTAAIFTNRVVSRSQGSLIITEGFASAWRTRTQNASTLSRVTANSTQIRLTFNNLPAGVTLGVAVSIDSATFSQLKAGFGSGGAQPSTTITSSANTAIIEFTGDSLTSTETLQLTVSISNVTSTAAVGTPGSITVTATMFPLGDGVDNSNPNALQVPTDVGGYPQFVQADVGPVTIVNIVAANTTLLLPYFAIVGAFDTGIAISNTTADPFGGSAGGGASPSSGTIKVDVFPTLATGGAGTPVSLTTSATAKPGAGLSSDGSLAAGAVWTVFMSQILSAAGSPTTNATGYAFITTNFLNAHGASTLTDFKTFSFTPGVFVLPPPSANSRNNLTHSNLGAGAEMLGP